MKSILALTNSGNSLVAYVIAKDETATLLYIPTERVLTQTTHRIRGTWLIDTTNFISLNKKSKANRDLLDFIRKRIK